MSERTSKDYAIEHAEYMAVGAESLLQALESEDALRLRRAESDDVEDIDIYDASVTRSVLASDLRDNIYEFRKRCDRAMRAAQAEPDLLAALQQAADAAQADWDSGIEPPAWFEGARAAIAKAVQ